MSNHSPPKSWIFVSHSHKDIDAVRSVRDELEPMDTIRFSSTLSASTITTKWTT